MKTFILTLAIIISFPFVCFGNDTLHIAVAANFSNCSEELNTLFAKNRKNFDIKTTSGSSGNIYAQIKNGAPFDIFLSADMSYPEKLVKDGLADGKNLIKYAKGKIVIWSKRDNLGLKQGINVLKDNRINRIAITNPELAPYGAAAKIVMEKAKLWDSVKDKIVFGENILQTMQYIDTGNADIGIIGLSLLKTPKMQNEGVYFEIPDDMYPPIIQGAVITSYGNKNPVSYEYLKFLSSDEAKNVLRKFGYGMP